MTTVVARRWPRNLVRDLARCRKNAFQRGFLIYDGVGHIVTSLLRQYPLALENQMKSLKIAVVACSLFAAAAASAQTEASTTNAPQQVTRTDASSTAGTPARRDAAKPTRSDDCVGPASFCNIYFGS